MDYPTSEDVLTLPPAYKLYKDSHIGIAAFLGGPLIGGYLAAENFKQLGQTRGARNAWIIGIAAMIFVISAVFFIPAIEHVPAYLFPLIYSTVTRFLVQKYQGTALRAHAAEGGKFYSGWRAAGISLIGVALIVALLFAVFYLQDLPQ